MDHRLNGSADGRGRAVEILRSSALGAEDEQHQGECRRNHIGRDNLLLNDLYDGRGGFATTVLRAMPFRYPWSKIDRGFFFPGESYFHG